MERLLSDRENTAAKRLLGIRETALLPDIAQNPASGHGRQREPGWIPGTCSTWNTFHILHSNPHRSTARIVQTASNSPVRWFHVELSGSFLPGMFHVERP